MDLSKVAWRKARQSAENGGNCIELAEVWRRSSYTTSNGGNCVEVAEAWQKSSHSGSNGGNCVEVAEGWRKSGHSGDNQGNCVELAGTSDRIVAVRDSKDPDGPVLLVTPSALRAAVRAAMPETA
jgi:hypothetical protein